MKISCEPTTLQNLYLVRHEIAGDNRGFFQEVYRADIFLDAGLDFRVSQVNQSGSETNVVRGLHFQWKPPMAKMMRVIRGRAFLVAVDIRRGSPTLGKWFGRVFAPEDRTQLYGAPGFARGFAVLSDYAEIEYMCTTIYDPAGESGILWNDPEIGIEWPLTGQPILSDKDRHAQPLREWLKRPEAATFSMDEPQLTVPGLGKS